MSAAGSQLALMLIDDRDRKSPAPAAPPAKKQSNSDELPAGALENAFERAKVRLAMASGEAMD